MSQGSDACRAGQSSDLDWVRIARVPLAGRIAHRRRAPRLAYGRHGGPPMPGYRHASVAVMLYPGNEGWSTLLIRRPQQARRHAGQVGFPGGAVEPGETSCQAMLRELDEEVGVCRDWVEPVRTMTPVYVFATRFLVQPWLCRAVAKPSFRPDPNEVHSLLELPLEQLLDARRWTDHVVTRGRLTFTAPALGCQGEPIWGATAVILSELQMLIESAAGHAATAPADNREVEGKDVA